MLESEVPDGRLSWTVRNLGPLLQAQRKSEVLEVSCVLKDAMRLICGIKIRALNLERDFEVRSTTKHAP